MRCNEDVRKFLLLSPHESNSNTIQNDMETIKSQLDNININIDVVVYVTGYVVHHVLKVKKCSNCKILLENEDEESPSTYFADINRGGLISPSKIASEFMIILTKIYVPMQKTLEKSQQPRNVLISSYLQIIEDHPKLDFSCASGSGGGSGGTKGTGPLLNFG